MSFYFVVIISLLYIGGVSCLPRECVKGVKCIYIQERCLSFWYHMRGATMGSLSVYTEGTTAGSKTQIWTRSGDQGNAWYQAKIDIPLLPEGSKISFKAVRGRSLFSDIALDDVMLTPGTCSQNATLSPTTWQPTTSQGTGDARSVTVGYCGFEDNEDCFLHNVVNKGDIDWRIISGPTNSIDTGPSSAFGGSKYIYMEASYRSKGDKAVLSTSELRLSGQSKSRCQGGCFDDPTSCATGVNDQCCPSKGEFCCPN